MNIKSFVCTLVLGFVFVGSAVLADDKEVKFDNPTPGKCPVSHKKIDETKTVTVDGKTYAFCCDKCMAKFKEHPEKYLTPPATK